MEVKNLDRRKAAAMQRANYILQHTPAVHRRSAVPTHFGDPVRGSLCSGAIFKPAGITEATGWILDRRLTCSRPKPEFRLPQHPIHPKRLNHSFLKLGKAIEVKAGDCRSLQKAKRISSIVWG
jgi:hypothetical protein